MQLKALALKEAFLLIPETIEDSRGFFARCFDAGQLEEAGLVTHYPEWSLSNNIQCGTLRGLHWQGLPKFDTKLVQCIAGSIFDVIVDLRPESETFGKWQGITLSSQNQNLLYVPAGFAHGFQTLEDNCKVYYHISVQYLRESSRGIRWDDPDIGIKWPETKKRTMSARDEALPLLSQTELYG